MKFKSILAFILAVMLLLCAVSCDEGNKETPAVTTTQPDNTPITVCEGKNSAYQIVTGEDNGGATTAAMKILMAVDTAFGVTLKRVTDKTAASDYEIIIGITNRYTPSPALAEKEYIICTKGKSVVITAGCDRALAVAAERFVNEYIKKDANGKKIYGSYSSVVKVKIKKFADNSLKKGVMKATFITVNSWNEWTETSYLEPDDLYGFGYLEALKDVFGEE